MTNRILDVSGLSVAFNRKAVEHGVNFHIDRGEALALVGESGSGELTEVFAHPLNVAHTDIGMVIFRIAHEQRFESIDVADQMGLPEAVLAAADRNDAIVVAAILGTIRLQ